MANISVTLYDGDFDVSYDCSGAIKCKYALWQEMPIDDDEHCGFRQYGACRNQFAQIDSMESARRRLAARIKDVQKDDE